MCFWKKKKAAKEVAKKEEAKEKEKVVEEKKPAPAKTEAKVLPEPKVTEKKEVVGRTYHVVKREEDGKWAVKFAGGSKVIKLFDTQKEAVAYTKAMADKQDGAMLVHNSKGANKGKIKKK